MATTIDPPVYLYALIDPETGAFRYVGETLDMQSRLKYYVRVQIPKPKAVQQWILELHARGLVAEMKYLRTTNLLDVYRLEQQVIASLRAKGCDLLNYAGRARNKREKVLSKKTIRRLAQSVA